MTTTIVLPSDLAPAQAERVQRLLAEVCLVDHPDPIADTWRNENTCVVCHRGGKLGGHHGPDGRIAWVHKSCHRRLHRRGTPTRKPAVLAHRLALLTAS